MIRADTKEQASDKDYPMIPINLTCGLLREAGPAQGRLPLLGEDLLFLLTVDSRLLPLPPVVRFSNLPMNRSLGLT